MRTQMLVTMIVITLLDLIHVTVVVATDLHLMDSPAMVQSQYMAKYANLQLELMTLPVHV